MFESRKLIPLVCNIWSSVGVDEYRSSLITEVLGLLLPALWLIFKAGGSLEEELAALDLAGEDKLLLESLLGGNIPPGRLDVDEELEVEVKFVEEFLKEFVILEKKLNDDVLLLFCPKFGGVVVFGDEGS